jgi:hypothetical protein
LSRIVAAALSVVLSSAMLPALAQQATEPHDHSHHAAPAEDHSQHGRPADAHSQDGAPQSEHSQHGPTEPGHHEHEPTSSENKGAKVPANHGMHSASHGSMQHGTEHGAHVGAPPHMQHGGHSDHAGMKGFLGPYPMNREGSGTSWLPDTTPLEGIHGQVGEWSTMWHSDLNLVYDQQGGPRGGDKAFVNGMLMGMAERPLGDGTLGVRAMLAPDPFMGKSGYPLLLASGETADGKTPLIDRQHPHDLFMELAGTYSYNLSTTSSVFVYAGLPGEPALGPPTFMHRTSGADIPEAPITHHWLDSTHITFGVITAGLVLDNWKIDGSVFRGREPDQYRYDIEAPKLDSFSGRLTWNPIRELSVQVSWGHLHSPEQLMPNVNEDRLTASAIYTQPFGDGNFWSTTAAWGRKMPQPGEALDGYLLETEVILKNGYTLFGRAERLAETELQEDVPALTGRVMMVNKITIGGIYDFYRIEHFKAGIGALVSKYWLPSELQPLYSSDPTSGMIFARVKVM